MFCAQQASKHAASAATQLINAAGGAGRSNRNQSSHQQLMTQCKAVADDVIPRLVHSLRASMQNPDNQNAQLALLTAAQDMLQVFTAHTLYSVVSSAITLTRKHVRQSVMILKITW